jgi:ABC-2 type transport system permease protein
LVALTRRALADARIRNISFAYLFAVIAYIQPVGYRNAYKTLAERISFARSFSGNAAIRLFYGQPHDLLTVSGYSAWRVGGTLAIAAAVWGVLAAVRAMRTEEDAGRAELVLSGAVSRVGYNVAALTAITLVAAAICLAIWAALVVGGLAGGGSAYLALSIMSVAPVFVGVGALASQLAPRRGVALALGGGVVAVSLLLRAVADTSAGVSWLRWLTPLGWAEEMRPFTGAEPWVLALPLAAAAVLLAVSIRIATRRDIGSGLLPVHDSADARLALLSTPAAQALRTETWTIVVWLACVGVIAYILGVISKSVTTAGISKQLAREIAKLGGGSISTAKGYLSFVFLMFVFAVSLFACAQVGAARGEESGGQLETLLALPVGRRGWLVGRVALAAGAAAAICLLAGVLAWLGAVSQGVHLTLGSMLLAGINCMPMALLSLAVGAVALAIVPRASAGIAYGFVVLAFLWDLFGSLLSAPHWLLQATPFAHVGLVPQSAFRGGAAALMLALAAAGVAAAVALFGRRDLVS